MPTLVYWDSDGVERRFEVGPEPVMIGRSSECAIRSEDTRVSRRHARITSDGRDCWIQDMGSANGVYVGQRRIEEAQIPPGEIIVVGSFLLQLQNMDGQPAVPSPGAHAQLSVWLKMERESRAAIIDERRKLATRVAELSRNGSARRESTQLSETTEQLSQQVEELRAELETASRRELENLRAEFEASTQREIDRALRDAQDDFDASKERDIERAVRHAQAELESDFARERRQLQDHLQQVQDQLRGRPDTAQNQDMEDALAEMSRQLDDADRQLGTARARIEKLENELAARDIRAKDERRAEAELRQHADNLAVEVERLRAASEDLAALEAENSELAVQRNQLAENLRQMRSDIQAGQAAERDNERLRGELAQLEAELEGARRTMDSLDDTARRVATLESENQTLAQKLSQTEELLFGTRDELEGLAEAANEIADERDEAIGKLHELRNDDSAAHNQLAILQREQQKLIKEREAVATRLQAAEEAADKAQKDNTARFSELQKEKYQTGQERDKLRKECEKLAREVEFLRGVDGGSALSSEQIEEFEGARRDVEEKLEGMTQERDALATEIGGLREEIAVLGAANQSSHEAMIALEGERDQLNQRIEELQDSASSLADDELSALRQDNARLRQGSREMAAEIEHLRAAGADAGADAERLREAEAELARLREAEAAVEQLREAEAELARLRESGAGLEEQLTGLREQLEAAEARARGGDEVAEQATSRIEALQHDLTELREQRDDLVMQVEEIDELRAQAAEAEDLRAQMVELEELRVRVAELEVGGVSDAADAARDAGLDPAELAELRAQAAEAVELRAQVAEADEQRVLRRQADERAIDLEDEIERLQGRITELQDQATSAAAAPPAAPAASDPGEAEIPAEITDNVIALAECIAALRSNMRAASDETAIMPPEEESTQVLTAAVSDAVEQIERARDSLRALGKIMDID